MSMLATADLWADFATRDEVDDFVSHHAHRGSIVHKQVFHGALDDGEFTDFFVVHIRVMYNVTLIEHYDVEWEELHG